MKRKRVTTMGDGVRVEPNDLLACMRTGPGGYDCSLAREHEGNYCVAFAIGNNFRTAEILDIWPKGGA